MIHPFVKNRLFCPGPTPVPLEIGMSALESNMYHRTDSFREVVLSCRRGLAPFFNTTEDPIILTSSGTGALESAVVNLTNEQDQVLVINGGKFGERWEKLASSYKCQLIPFKIEWGTSPDLKELEKLLSDNPNCKAVFFQANETSTGVAFPVEHIAATIRKVAPQALIIVDAVSGLIAHKIDMNNWGLDCVVSGSQKGFGIPPGLSFISLSERAWNSLTARPKFYFDLKKERAGQKTGETSWTPATTLILSLKSALDKLNVLGPDGCDLHHRKLALACRAAVEAIGLELFPRSHLSQALTAVKLPNSIDGSKLIKLCREKYGAIFAGGQDHLKGKILRISHLGFVDHLDLVSGIAALEMGLASLGFEFNLGAGTGAAMKTLLQQEQS